MSRLKYQLKELIESRDVAGILNGLEDLPGTSDAVSYLQQLARDERGQPTSIVDICLALDRIEVIPHLIDASQSRAWSNHPRLAGVGITLADLNTTRTANRELVRSSLIDFGYQGARPALIALALAYGDATELATNVSYDMGDGTPIFLRPHLASLLCAFDSRNAAFAIRSLESAKLFAAAKQPLQDPAGSDSPLAGQGFRNPVGFAVSSTGWLKRFPENPLDFAPILSDAIDFYVQIGLLDVNEPTHRLPRTLGPSDQGGPPMLPLTLAIQNGSPITCAALIDAGADLRAAMSEFTGDGRQFSDTDAVSALAIALQHAEPEQLAHLMACLMRRSVEAARIEAGIPTAAADSRSSAKPMRAL